MARAMATRCCWPPESWPGSLSPWPCEPHERRAPRRRARPISALRHAAHLQAEADVAAHGHVREQRVVLEHHAEAALLGRSASMRLLVEPDAAAGHRQQAGDAVERRRLAAARRAEQRDELAAPDGRGVMSRSALSAPKSRLTPSRAATLRRNRLRRAQSAASARRLAPCSWVLLASSCRADLLVPACGRRRPACRARAAARCGLSAISFVVFGPAEFA